MPEFALAAPRRPLEDGTGDISDIRPRRRISSPAGVFALLVALLSGALVTFGPATPAAAGEPEVIHSLVNDARAANGLAPLKRNGSLDAVAAAWAQQMANDNRMYHNPNVGSQIPGGWSRCGENVAQGHDSGAAMQQAWMESSGHYKNIMGDFTDIGVAFIEAGGTTWGVQVFAKYSGGAGGGAAPPPAVKPEPKPEPEPEPEPEPTAEEQAAEDRAAEEKAAADKAAAEKAEAEKKKAAERKAAEKKKAAADKKAAAEKKAAAAKTAAKKKAAAEKKAAAAGSVPTATAAPGPAATERAATPLSTSVTAALAPAANPVVLIGMGLVLLVALVLISPTLRRVVLPRRRRPRHR
ncbi:CAP domain-containing protein [Lysobacter korlensis]|uniref:CAP domain-containing protein n=1 Tax=Lysobacter korlensis TaxID=553636 RepID=A0ABV6RXH6_9GAMM